jgi:tetratricopeptide (TPR) repeat protein
VKTNAQVQADVMFDTALEAEASDSCAAILLYERILKLKPSHPEALINLGRLYNEAGMKHAAMVAFKRAIMAAPEHPVAWFNLGVTAHDLGDRDLARVCYRKALAIDSTFDDARCNLRALSNS